MNENITTRVGRLISGSMNALIDAVENTAPEAVMDEAIREVDSAIDDVRAELGRTVASKHVASKRLMDENRRYERLAENIEVAVKESRDDLAAAAISQQLDIEAQIPVLEAAILDSSTHEKELESYISALQAKKREMQEELRLYRESQKHSSVGATTEAGTRAAGSNSVKARVEKAGGVFDRVLEQATGVAAASSSGCGENASRVAELEQLTQQNRVSERLAAIKSKMDETSK
ncbi:MAG: PspA/IM30 family protein [Gammaproteobacteria bacterium]|nr:PspA/IM30 family protein [Gammaproteobacteria bacterium]